MAETTEGTDKYEGTEFEGKQLRAIVGAPQETGTTTDPKPDDQAPVVVPTTEEPVVINEYWKTVSEKTGYQFQSEDELVEELKSGRGLGETLKEYEQRLKTLDNLDPLAKDIDRAAKAGIDINLYLEARNMEVDKLDAKETIKQKFLRDNQDLVKDNKEAAYRKFERDYQRKFGVLDLKADLSLKTDEEKAAIEQQIEDAKLDLQLEHSQAKRYMADWKQKHVTISEPQAQGMSKEQVEHYYNEANAAADELESFDIPVGDKVFKFGLENYRDSLREDLSNPLETLKRFGLDLEKATIDPRGLAVLLAAHYAIEDIGKPLSDYALEQFNAQTVRSQLQNPIPANRIAPGDPGKEPTEHQLVAAAFRAQREAQRQAGD